MSLNNHDHWTYVILLSFCCSIENNFLFLPYVRLPDILMYACLATLQEAFYSERGDERAKRQAVFLPGKI